MLINCKELSAVAVHPSIKFDKEGFLLLRDRQEGLFTSKEVFHQRWFRLRGNLLFFCVKKEQFMEAVGLIVLEQCTINLDNIQELPYSFTLSFRGDPVCRQLVAFSEPELEEWMCALHVANYGFIRSRLFSLRKRLKKKRTGFMGALGDSADVHAVQEVRKRDSHSQGFIFSSQDEPFLEVRLGCDNLKCDPDGRQPNPVVEVSVLVAPFRWLKCGSTDIVQRSSNPVFFSTISFTKNYVTMMTRIKFSVYNVLERVTDTRVMMGESILALGVLLQDTNAALRYPLWSGNRQEAGFITINTSLLREVIPKNWKRRITSASPEKIRTCKKIYCGARRLSLPSNLSDSSNSFLYGNLNILFDDIVSQSYRFPTKLGSEVSVHEIMGESKLAFRIPQQLLNIWIKEEQQMLAVLLNLGELRKEWHARHNLAVERQLQLINHYLHSLDILVNNKGIHLKKSSQKADHQLDFVPVNLHLQRLIIQNQNTKRGTIHDVITVGAFTAYSHGLKSGGLLSHLNQTNSSCQHFKSYDNVKLVSTSDPLKRAAETLIRVEHLVTSIEVDLQELLHFASLKIVEDLRSIIFSLKNKALQLTQLSNPHLVEESLAIWEFARPSDTAPLFQKSDSKQDSTHEEKASRNSQKKEKLKRPQHLAVIKNTSQYHFEGPSTIYISESKSADGPDTKNKCTGCGPGQPCTTSLAEFLPSPVGSPEEFEPLELTHLNIRASIMCMASKLKSLTKSEAAPSDCWALEFAPSVKKLRQAMRGLSRTAKLTYSLLSLRESSQISQSYIIKHRRDVVFSQALTSLLSGILTRIWCQNIESVSIEQLLTDGLLAEFECLLSCYGDNLAMLEDMIVAIYDLNRTFFWLEATTSKSPKPRIEGSRVSLSVIIPVPSSLLSNFTKSTPKSCRLNVTCVFFNIGVNESADLGEKLGFSTLQENINLDSFTHLLGYYQNIKKTSGSISNKTCRSSLEPSIPSLLDQLKQSIQSRESKNVKVLHLAAEICSRLQGIRFTSCKSAKDRTGMAVTLEQAMVLQRMFQVDDKVFQRILDSMRSCGTRRTNTLKNVGVRKYAFNSLQVRALPCQYRPPLGTFGNVQT